MKFIMYFVEVVICLIFMTPMFVTIVDIDKLNILSSIMHLYMYFILGIFTGQNIITPFEKWFKSKLK